ncbi:hypothetical protein [Bradyrhizobium sp. STM 3562]|uniref:hypothetical protein n=1 Tax=Bradyrhizobium sp. STM 3562 TaxID=578924 RepID=UPI0038905D64
MAEVITDHDAIRRWAEQHGGKPAAVGRTHQGDDVGIVRIMFPEAPHSEHAHLVEISFEEFEGVRRTPVGAPLRPESLFSKIIGLETAERREHDAARHS